MSDLKLTFDNVSVKVSEFLGTGGTATSKSKDITYRGYRNFLFPLDMTTGKLHYWSFLRKYDTLNTIGDQWKYSLPSDFSNIHIEFSHDTQSGYPRITKVSPQAIWSKRRFTEYESYPTLFAITPGTYTKETGTIYEVWFHGTPNAAYIIPYWYVFEPEKPTATTDVFVGGIMASEAILESALAVAETQEDDTIDIHSQLATQAIQRLIEADKGTEADYLGRMAGSSEIGTGRFLETINENEVYE